MDRALSSFSKLRQKSSKDLSGSFSSREYPSDPACYELLEDCGRGVSATVHRAACMATNEIVAVKKMNLERVSMSLEEIIHEAQTMKSYHHPNVLPLFTSFVHGQDLWMVTPFMSGGSILHIMKYRFPKGLDEVSIATVMKYVLLGLEYVHKNGGIHRDVKAGNILMDRDGTVRLGDFGVAATPSMRDGDWKQDKQQRTTFVGTPCWMAPEVMEQAEYNSKADIWSFGITLLELANGHAPFAKFPPMKVLLMTLQGPAPQLDDQPGKPHFSKLMRNVIARCLQKDPTQRPTATDLLQDKFFKQSRDEDYLVRTLLNELPALGERVQMIREGKAATNAAENDRQLERSQEEYKRGVSMWNFDVSALKAQAALDDGGLASIAEEPSAAAEGAGGGDGSGSSSRRSTDDAASLQQPAGAAGVASPPAAAAAAAATLPPVATSAAAVQEQQQQQPVELVQQQLPALQVPPTLQNMASMDEGAAHTQQQLQQVQQQQQPQQQQPQQAAAAEAAAKAASAQQQQQQSNMRRAASAFAGSHALAAAAADMSGGAGGSSGNGGNGSISSSSAPGLASHYSEPAAVSQQQQQQHSSSLPPPAPYAGAAYTGLSSGSLAGAGASSGGSSYCLSPPNTSPPMSRESSSQGPLSSLTTPEALQLRGKSKGRFQVYEHGVQAPPLSPGATRTSGPLQEGLSGSFTRGTTPTAAAAAAAAAAGVASASIDSASAPLPAAVPLVPRMSDSTGQTTETPRAGRQLNATEAAELKAAAVAATAAAGTNGGSNAAAAGAQSVVPATAATPPAAAGGDAAAAGAAGTTANTSTCPTPPPGSTTIAAAAGGSGSGLNLPGMATSGTASIDAGDGSAAAAGAGAAPSTAAGAGAAPEPKKKGRFKIIEEDGPSRGPSKVSSSADLRASASSAALAAAAGGGAGGVGSSSSQRGMLGSSGSIAAALPELLRLHEQSVSHANSLARVIDSMRSSCSGGNLSSAEDLMLLGSGGVLASVPSGQQAAGGGALPPRKPAAGAGGAGVLSRANSSRLLVLSGAEGGVVVGVGGGVRGAVSLQQLLQESNGDAMDVAEKLFERVQDLERQVSSLEVELGRGLSRTPDYVRLKPLDGTTPTTASSSTQISAAPSGVPADLAAIATSSSADPSRAASRRTSVANLALSAASPTAAAAANIGGSNGGTAAGLVERHSSSGTSGGGGGNGGAAAAESGSGGGAAQPPSAAS